MLRGCGGIKQQYLLLTIIVFDLHIDNANKLWFHRLIQDRSIEEANIHRVPADVDKNKYRKYLYNDCVYLDKSNFQFVVMAICGINQKFLFSRPYGGDIRIQR